MNTVTILLLVTVASAWICYSIAKQRQANTTFWVVMGVLFGPLAIPFVFLSRPKKK